MAENTAATWDERLDFFIAKQRGVIAAARRHGGRQAMHVRTVQANKSKQKKIKRAPFPSVDLNRLASLFCRTLDILYAPGVASRASLSDGCRALGEW